MKNKNKPLFKITPTEIIGLNITPKIIIKWDTSGNKIINIIDGSYNRGK